MSLQDDQAVSSSESVSEWIAGLKAGDDAVAQRLWQRYVDRLVRLAARKLGNVRRAPAGSDDVALSAFHALVRGARESRFPRLADRDDLWQVLVMLVERNAIRVRRREHAARRGGGRVRGDSALLPARGSSVDAGFNQVADPRPTPQFAAAVGEQLSARLAMLADLERRIALGKLEGYTNAELAQSLGLSLRAIERKLAIIRRRWGKDAT